MMLSMAPCSPLDLLLAHDAMQINALPGCRLTTEQPTLTAHDDHYTLALRAPGVAPCDLTIEVNDGKLVVKGETHKARHTHFVNYAVALPTDADSDSATATSADGLLTVTVPKRAPAAPVSIAVSADADMADADEDDEEAEDKPRPYTLTIAAAGLAPTDVSIALNADGLLEVTGETARTGAKLSRRFRLPRDADVSTATASHIDGLLCIVLPKKAAPEPKKVEVKTTAAAAVATAAAAVMNAAAEAAATNKEASMSAAPEAEAADAGDDEEDGVMV